MSAIQASQTDSVFPFVLGGVPYLKDNETLLTDASRTVPLAQYTIMAQVASSGKWVPWTSLTASDGTAWPTGILMNDGGVTAAALAAADVTGAQILIGGMGCQIDNTQLVFDKGSTGGGTPLTLTSILVSNATGSGTATPYWTIIAERQINTLGLFPTTTVALDQTEN